MPLPFLCDQLVSQQHISHLFVRAMAAAGLGLRKSGKSRAKSSTQGWSPNSGQSAEDQSGVFVDVLVSEQGQHSSSSGLTLPQQQNQQAGSQTQSASSMDQLQNGLVQYQPSGSNPEPRTANALGQYQPAGNNETPLARDCVCVPPACTIHVGTHHARSATTGKRSASTALAGTHNLANTDSRAGSVPFPKPRALVLPLVHFGQSKPEGHSGLDTADSDLMHHQFRLSLLQWNPGPARKHPINIVSAASGKFHAVILQEASDHVPHISDQFMAYTGNTDLAILLNKDTFEPDPTVNTFKADSTSKGTWSMILLIVRGLLRRPSLTGSPTVTFLLSTHPQCSG